MAGGRPLLFKDLDVLYVLFSNGKAFGALGLLRWAFYTLQDEA